jgi:hypothetical protein
MEYTRILNLEHALRPSEKYVVGCLGAAGLIIGAAGWICNGGPLGWMPRQVGLIFAWSGLVLLQLLTLYVLKRRLAALRQSLQWVWPVVALWVGFDTPLIASRHAYMFLPLLYGASQVLFLFDVRKAEPNDESSEPK